MSRAAEKDEARGARERLRECKLGIVEAYAAALPREITAATVLDREQLIDSLPKLLDAIIAHSSTGAPSLDALGAEHGRTRAQRTTYSLPDLLKEHRILKGLVNGCLRRSARLPREAEDDVNDALDAALGASVVAFAQQRAHKLLVDATRAEERHKLEAIFAGSPAAMALWRGPDMVFELVNPAYQAIFPGRTLIGRPFLEALPEFRGQPFFEHFSRVLATGEPYIEREALARHRSTADGPIEDHYYDFSYVRIDDERGRPYAVYDHAVDVTARVLARRALSDGEEHLRAAVNELTQERATRERLVAGISHDLRTPLSAARMSAYLLARRAHDQEAVRKGAGRIANNLDRVDGMLRDLLDASRLSAGQDLPLDFEACDLRQIAEETLVDVRALYGERFVLESAPTIPGTWNGPALRRILENLCSNAAFYGSATAPITVSLRARGGRVELRVHNHGPPMPPEALSRLFEPFHVNGEKRARGHRGWGLGLTLVRGLARAHGGDAVLESSGEEGTTFCVTLPAESSSPPSTAAP